MNTSLNDALALLNLQPGKPYRTTVNGQEVEVRVLEKGKEEEPNNELSQFADQVMFIPWFSIPNPSIKMIVKVQPGSLPLPDPPFIPRDEEG